MTRNEKNFWLVRIPKTASRMLLWHSNFPFKAHHHLNANQLYKRFGESFLEAFKVTFIRNPYDLVASTYYFMQTLKPGSDWYKQSKPLCRLANTGNFLTFCQRGFKIVEAENYPHLRSFSFFTRLNGVEIIDFVGKLETLQTDMKRLCSIAKQPSSKLPVKHKVKRLRKGNYTSEIAKIVYDRYAEDFTKYEYDVESWHVY